jgi:putative SOS response-associated peptidase YedK
MGLPAGSAESSAGHQFSLGRSKFPVGRCLIPASFFYEFTGKKSPKTKWRFSRVGEDWFCFAGLWRPIPDDGAAFALLTTDPSVDVGRSAIGRW